MGSYAFKKYKLAPLLLKDCNLIPLILENYSLARTLLKTYKWTLSLLESYKWAPLTIFRRSLSIFALRFRKICSHDLLFHIAIICLVN